MNRDEAKYVLRSYHLRGLDAGDPQFREALEMLACDPELAAWFEAEQAIDRKLSEKFQAFPVPAELRSQLLAARKVVSAPVLWWRRPAWIGAAAAGVALLGALAILGPRMPEQRSFAEFRSYIASAAAKVDHLDFETSDLGQIRQWLGSHSAPGNFTVPGRLNGTSSLGCRVFAWNGQKVSLVCFELENKKVAHLFVMDRSALTNLPDGGAMQFQTTPAGMATASWSDARRIYIVAMERGEQDLKRLLL
jgi:hypothetical protein